MHLIHDGVTDKSSDRQWRTPALPLLLIEPLPGALSFAALPLAAPWLARALATLPQTPWLRRHGWGLDRIASLTTG